MVAFDLQPGVGLTASVDGVPFVRGSWFQYYEPDWTRGYFSSTYEGGVRRVEPDGTIRLDFRSRDGRAFGWQKVRREGDTLVVQCRFEWTGERPVKVEWTPAMLWTTPWERGQVDNAGVPSRSPAPTVYAGQDLESRRYGPDAAAYRLRGPIGQLLIEADRPLTLFDGRGYAQPWAEGKPVFWLGDLGLEVARDRPAEATVRLTLPQVPDPPRAPVTFNTQWNAEPSVLAPPDRPLPLIPKPKIIQFDSKKPVPWTGKAEFPAGYFRVWRDFEAALARRFVLPAPSGAPLVIDGGVSKQGLREGGYRIQIRTGSISVLGQDEEGLRTAMERLAQLAFVQNGRLVFPSGTVVDEPKLGWRGVHLFVGPKAVPFHQRLWTRVLRPLGFNHVLLQCERTAWEATPGVATSITMPKAELKRLFAMYRALGVDPIPLVQSFGHMEWLFANGRNLDLTIDPKDPYAVDPRKPEVQALLRKLWAEVVQTTQPSALHFGLDEVDMRGFPDDEALVTELWGVQLPFLGGIAKAHGLPMMLWGDKALAPGEAVDAALAPDRATAQKRRNAIPKGAIITDWHYKGDPNPEPFRKSLQVWKADRHPVIASTWYPPANVRGFALAAIQEKIRGLLQTTWAGYESSEAVLDRDLKQFSAMVLAADYAWSGREEMPEALGYDPTEVFRRMYYGRPATLKATPGMVLGGGEVFSLDGIRFVRLMEPLALGSVLDGGSLQTVSVPVGKAGATLALALDTRAAVAPGEVVARLKVETEGGTVTRDLRYGADARAGDDSGFLATSERVGGVGVVRVDLGKRTTVRRITLEPMSKLAGLRLHGAALY